MQCDALAAEGASVAPTAAAVIAASDITFGMLADPAAALAVAEGPDGVGAGIKANPGKAYVDVSTVDEQTSQKIAALVVSSGGRFLEVRSCSHDCCDTWQRSAHMVTSAQRKSRRREILMHRSRAKCSSIEYTHCTMSSLSRTSHARPSCVIPQSFLWCPCPWLGRCFILWRCSAPAPHAGRHDVLVPSTFLAHAPHALHLLHMLCTCSTCSAFALHAESVCCCCCCCDLLS